MREGTTGSAAAKPRGGRWSWRRSRAFHAPQLPTGHPGSPSRAWRVFPPTPSTPIHRPPGDGPSVNVNKLVPPAVRRPTWYHTAACPIITIHNQLLPTHPSSYISYYWALYIPARLFFTRTSLLLVFYLSIDCADCRSMHCKSPSAGNPHRI